MRISFIGMSNIGKTFWSKRLAAASGIARIDCDALIEARLGAELSKQGYHGIRDVAKWMGQPPDPHYKDTSAQYIACERDSLSEALDRQSAANTPVIIDTTGSVIYTGDALLARLRELTQVIYLEASDKYIDGLFRRYIDNPKPVIWGDCFVPQPEETQRESLARCFPDLLRQRAARYKALAHITIPFDRHKDRKADIATLIKEAIS